MRAAFGTGRRDRARHLSPVRMSVPRKGAQRPRPLDREPPCGRRRRHARRLRSWPRDPARVAFSQRLTVTFADDDSTMEGLAKPSYDDETWQDDLQITYRR